MFSTLQELSASLSIPLWLLIVVITWTLLWKGVALWISARKNHAIWFVLILVVQTLGILEILYVFLFSKIKLEDTKRPKQRKSRINKNKFTKQALSLFNN